MATTTKKKKTFLAPIDSTIKFNSISGQNLHFNHRLGSGQNPMMLDICEAFVTLIQKAFAYRQREAHLHHFAKFG